MERTDEENSAVIDDGLLIEKARELGEMGRPILKDASETLGIKDIAVAAVVDIMSVHMHRNNLLLLQEDFNPQNDDTFKTNVAAIEALKSVLTRIGRTDLVESMKKLEGLDFFAIKRKTTPEETK